MKLYAILATINVDVTQVFSRNFVETYLKGQFSPRLVERSIRFFDQYMEELSPLRSHEDNKRIARLSVKILMICEEINQELPLKSKFLILISIIQFARHFKAQSGSGNQLQGMIGDAVTTISEALMINEHEYRNCQAFIGDRFFKVPDRSSLLVVSSMDSFQFSDIRHSTKEGVNGQFFFLRISQADLYIFYYTGNDKLELAGKHLFPNHIYVFPKGAAIKADSMPSFYYGDMVAAFRKGADYPKISLSADKIQFMYPNSDNGIHELSLHFTSGEMVGVMGGSGTGKSTLMRVLNGSFKPDRGTVFINGIPLDKEDERQQGVLGFVPQDDLLIEELTVFENLYYNARLCLGDLSERDVIKRIGKVLNNLGLFYIKDLKVGSVLNKSISGGQRKRLNIALELIREPYILFVDEPTSGLSSTDSENVLSLLKEQSLSGKIVLINIHQPSSELFKMFDKIIIMDKGGYPVYVGNPLDSIHYLKNMAHRADAAEIQCETCGNVNTDDILKIIEAKKVNEFGEYTKDRTMEPEEWYELFKTRIPEPEIVKSPEPMPGLNFKIPNWLKQFFIYSERNFFSKIADTQFVLLSLTISPLLALILGFFTKYLGGFNEGEPVYFFSLNENIPAYLFMCVIVSLFIGLIVSAEEIIRDRKIRARESFLNLSKYSYINSKILFLFVLSAIQMFVFVLIGNSILGIKGLNFNYWLILFTTSSFAVMLGLNISAGLKSIISIYINIPFILVPLILLSGVIVKYDKLHYKVAGEEFVPMVGELMASRWAYEALVVNQFRNNDYESSLFEAEKEEANVLYYLNYLLPEINNRMSDLNHALADHDEKKAGKIWVVLQNTFYDLSDVPEQILHAQFPDLPFELIDAYLSQWKEYLEKESARTTAAKDAAIQRLQEENGGREGLIRLKQNYHNQAVEELVLNSNDLIKIREVKGKLVRKDSPIFQVPRSNTGRAQFFASTKVIGGFEFDTFWFNISVLWFMTVILYIALVRDSLRKVIDLFSFTKVSKRKTE